MRKFLEKFTRDQEGSPIFGTHPGDVGVVVVAFLITCGFVYMLLVPQNWSAIDRAMAPDGPKPVQAQGKKGETEMIIYDHTQKK